MRYQNLEQRIAKSYLDTLPGFVPDGSAPVGIAGQRRFYGLIRDLYQLAYDEPELFAAELHGDDAVPGRMTMTAYGKPKLRETMKKFSKAVDALLLAMFKAGKGEEVRLSGRQAEVLLRLGIGNLRDLPPAWVWMASREGADFVEFKHCLFDREYPYASDLYAELLGREAFRKLENWMLERGYRRYLSRDVIASDCKFSLTVANPAWDAEPPRGGYEYKIRHTGIAALYDERYEEPQIFGLCIPGGMKPYLEAFGSMEEELKRFVVRRTKKCDACGYCTQTDKTGKRPRAYVPVEFGGGTYPLCTYFPGYNYRWTAIDDKLAEDLMRMLEFMDRFVAV